MRRLVNISMPVFLVLTIVIGFAESGQSNSALPVAHIFVGVLFTATASTHLWLNRKAFMRCFAPAKSKKSGKSQPGLTAD